MIDDGRHRLECLRLPTQFASPADISGGREEKKRLLTVVVIVRALAQRHVTIRCPMGRIHVLTQRGHSGGVIHRSKGEDAVSTRDGEGLGG